MEKAKTGKIAQSKRYSRKAYEEFVDQVELKDIWLAAVELDRQGVDELDKSHYLFAVFSQIERTSDGFDGFTYLTVSALTDADRQNDLDYSINVDIQFGARYKSDIEPTDRFLKQFGEASLQSSHWPYLGALVDNLLVQAGWRPFKLPLFSEYVRSMGEMRNPVEVK